MLNVQFVPIAGQPIFVALSPLSLAGAYCASAPQSGLFFSFFFYAKEGREQCRGYAVPVWLSVSVLHFQGEEGGGGFCLEMY